MIKHNWLVVLAIWLFTAVVMVLQPIVGILFTCVSMMTTAAMLEYARQESAEKRMPAGVQMAGKVKRNQKKRRSKQVGRNASGLRTW